VFITWDDWGGWFDHVVPPNVEEWNRKMAPQTHFLNLTANSSATGRVFLALL